MKKRDIYILSFAVAVCIAFYIFVCVVNPLPLLYWRAKQVPFTFADYKAKVHGHPVFDINALKKKRIIAIMAYCPHHPVEGTVYITKPEVLYQFVSSLVNAKRIKENIGGLRRNIHLIFEDYTVFYLEFWVHPQESLVRGWDWESREFYHLYLENVVPLSLQGES